MDRTTTGFRDRSSAPPARIVRRGSPAYPPLLLAIPDPPEQLHCSGDIGLLCRTAVAVVGSRKASPMGRAMAERLGAALAGRGIVVVSGCAVGIDAGAHAGALSAGGPTVAVLGGGLDVAAPPSNRKLAARIARDGCLVTEFPPGTPPLPYHFPRRNRIIAGLARIVVVVEAAARSGALTTVRHALAAGREVMAVPGHPFLPNAAGVNGLLVDGARLVLSPDHVLEELGGLPGLEGLAGLEARPARPASDPEGPPRDRLLAALGEAPTTAERLAEAARVPLAETLATLTALELLGLVRSHVGNRYSEPVPAPRRERLERAERGGEKQ
ncbi:MAG: DNA-processing protein DprA [Gemmatimonadota bacterium]